MFKLQRLEITGFKSFADYTEIVFTGNGITAVVGPNGCGKSNVSESISWVLGEQRPKALRGAEMKDVVFQGTKARKPGGMAEVVLHLVRDGDVELYDDEEDLTEIDEALGAIDEAAVDVDALETGSQSAEDGGQSESSETTESSVIDEQPVATEAEVIEGEVVTEKRIKTKRHWRPRRFALEFAPGESISVTRRLYLSGESEYLLNGKICRLRDIQDLFAGTGLSGAHYAIIEQGRIGQILSAKPAERRSLIEEAAGISKFRTRQRAAEARLEGAKSNLHRISDIVSEVEKQANSLRRQAARTRRYKQLREEFRVLLKQLFVGEGRYLTDLVAELEVKLTEAVKKEHELQEVAEKKEVGFKEATSAARTAEEALAAVRARHADNALERDRTAREKIYREEQVEALRSRAATLQAELVTLNERLELCKSEIERLKKEEEKDRAEADVARAAFKEAEDLHLAKVDELRKIEAELEIERNAVIQHTAAVERFGEIERQLNYNLERLTERVEGLQREGIRADESLISHSQEATKLESELKEKRERLSTFNQEKQALLTVTADSRGSLQTAEKTLAEMQSEHSLKQNRLETLRELDQQRAVYAPAVQKIYANQSEIGVTFLGTLAEKIDVDKGNERAIENLFGPYLETILVETSEDARKLISWHRANGGGRLSVLVTGPLGSGGKSFFGFGSSSNNKLGFPDDLAVVLKEVFPLEMAAVPTRSITNADSDARASLIDEEGSFVLSGRFFVSDGKVEGDAGPSVLSFRREMRELEGAIGELASKLQQAEQSTVSTRQALSAKEEQVVDLQSLIVQIERDVLSLEIQEKTAKQETERAERHKKVVLDETKLVEGEISDLRLRLQEARESASLAEAARVQSSNTLEQIASRIGEARNRIEADMAALNDKRTFAATSDERQRSAQNAVQRIEAEFRDLENRKVRTEADLHENEGKSKWLVDSLEEINRKIACAAEEIANETLELGNATAMLTEARNLADTLSNELSELNRTVAEAREERAAIDIRKAESVTELKNINDKCAQEVGSSLAELVEREELEEGFDLVEARGRSVELREKLEDFGAINMLALEELTESEERLVFLTSQMNDIVDGIAAAEEALREIKSRSRERFRKAFESINENFQEFFRELFGGGHGEMTLLEADDILEAGIEIVAQPPGKRLQNILLLSGGEKAMTAIALVMAIFKYRPSPFCLLDEVDAPLDEANVGRFVTKVAEMAEKTQFIVITHNKRTMEAAKALYGVTMQEPGVSKVVSVRFE